MKNKNVDHRVRDTKFKKEISTCGGMFSQRHDTVSHEHTIINWLCVFKRKNLWRPVLQKTNWKTKNGYSSRTAKSGLRFVGRKTRRLHLGVKGKIVERTLGGNRQNLSAQRSLNVNRNRTRPEEEGIGHKCNTRYFDHFGAVNGNRTKRTTQLLISSTKRQ